MKFDRELFERLVSESTATAMLMVLGCMGCMPFASVSILSLPRSLLDMGFCFGLGLMAATHTFRGICEVHVNPAVSASACIVGKIDWKEMLMYMAVQLLGAFVGFLLIMAVVPERLDGKDFVWSNATICTTLPGGLAEDWQALLLEYFMTCILLFAYCAIWDDRTEDNVDSWPIKIGLIVAGLTFAAGRYTGTSLNFTRTLPPNLIQEHFTPLWIYLVAHILAVATSPVLWRFFFTEKN